MSREVKCPRCGKSVQFSSENLFRPFCSERCKLIDLGQWAEGKYTIPVVDVSDIEEVNENATTSSNEAESENPDVH